MAPTRNGRRRRFFGRLNDDATIREAIAYDPQGSVGDILNLGMLQVWRDNTCQLLLQIHDAILVQYPESREETIIPLLLETIKAPAAPSSNGLLAMNYQLSLRTY